MLQLCRRCSDILGPWPDGMQPPAPDGLPRAEPCVGLWGLE